MTEHIYILIPITFLLSIVAVVGLFLYFRYQRIRTENEGGGRYRELAEEAVRGQRALLDEVTRLNATMKEIELILRQV